MGYLLLHIFIILLIVIAGWGLLIAWVVGGMFRLMWKGFSFLGGGKSYRRSDAISLRRCSGMRCRAMNPLYANYCRRCGTPLIRTAPAARVPQPGAPRGWAAGPVSF